MKKILFGLVATLFSATAYATQTVNVIWPFNIGSTQANYARALIKEANQYQNRWVFVLENKPGAGSSIAANHVASNKEPSIMAATSSFFIRPNIYPDSSHNVDQFRTLMIQCAVPMIIVSKKYKSFRDIGISQRVTIGVSGLGTTTHLLTSELRKKLPGIVAVPYTGTMEPIKDVIGDNLDMAVGFPGELKQFIDSGMLNVIGISGKKTFPGMPLLQNQGFVGSELAVNTHFLAIPKSIPDSIINDWKEIFTAVSKKSSVLQAHAVDNCQEPGPTNLEKWFDSQIRYWQQITKDIKIN